MKYRFGDTCNHDVSYYSEIILLSCAVHHFAKNRLVLKIFACKEDRGALSEAQNGDENIESYTPSLPSVLSK
jgi:hypothetical protein